jgi:tetratricopeptide (TPR) repeat protein
MKDYPNAIGYYKKVLTLSPDNKSALDNLGYCYLANGDYSSALENFNKCSILQPDYIDAILGVTLAYYYKNDLMNAKKYLDRAKELKPILKQGVEGFESFKKEGWVYTEKDDNTLKKILVEFK